MALSVTLLPVAGRPNIVFLLTDDQEASFIGGDWHMPTLREEMASKGANFTACVTNFPLCCPSRASILTSMCSHNTGVLGLWPPHGGMFAFNKNGLEEKAVPLVLQKSGYRTGLVGKYLNGYDHGIVMAATHPVTHIPPGWDTWFAMRRQGYFDWEASDQGREVKFGSSPGDYSTDVFTAEAVKFIARAAADPRPFFLYLAPFAPHNPWVPAPRHAGKLAGVKLPRVPSFNESSATLMTKVAASLRAAPPLSLQEGARLELDYQMRQESLLAVDDQLAAVIKALKDARQLDNTYIFYNSDNGFKLGHHRKVGKLCPYEASARVPLYVRGPGVARGAEIRHLVSNLDLAPTWVELAGATDPYAAERDGRSFAPLLRAAPAGGGAPPAPRAGVLIERTRKARPGKKPPRAAHARPGRRRRRLPLAADTLRPVPRGAGPVTAGVGAGNGSAAGRFSRLSGSSWRGSGWHGGGWPGEGWRLGSDESLRSGDDYARQLDDDYDDDDWPGSEFDRRYYAARAAERGVAFPGFRPPPPAPRAAARRRSLQNAGSAGKGPPGGQPAPRAFRELYIALRLQTASGSLKLIKYPGDPRRNPLGNPKGNPLGNPGYELYDLEADPFELTNVYASTPEALRVRLEAALDALAACKGAACSLDDSADLRIALESWRR